MAKVYINVNNIQLIRQIDNRKISPTEKRLLEVMSGYARDDGGNIFPTLKTLGHETGYSDKCIRNKIESLTNKGFIKRRVEQPQGSHKPHEYVLNLELIKSSERENKTTEEISKELGTADHRYDVPHSPVPDTADHRYDVPTNKYLINNEEVNEEILLASSESSDSPVVVSPTFPNGKPVAKKKAASGSNFTNTDNDQAFEEFWGLQEWKVDKLAARKEFDKAVVKAGGGEMGRHRILESARMFKAVRDKSVEFGIQTKEEAKRFTKRPLGWLRNEKWNDELEMPSEPTTLARQNNIRTGNQISGSIYKTAHEKRDEEIRELERQQQERLARIVAKAKAQNQINQLVII